MQEQMQEQVGETLCKFCDVPILKHRKCKHCEILLHEEQEDFKCKCGEQHNKECEFNAEFCEDCFYSIYK